MQTNRLSLRNVIAIVICLAGLTMFSGCEKEPTENSLVGKWTTSDYHAGDSDTIAFTEDLQVRQYFDYIFANQVIPALYLPPYVTYSLLGDKIKFTIHYFYPNEGSFDETFYYVLNGNSLIIKGFSNPFSVTAEARSDVRFKRVK